MTRQDKRSLDEILAVKARKKKKAAGDDQFEPDSLVIGVNAGGCIVAGDDQSGITRLCHTKISVVPGDRVAITP